MTPIDVVLRLVQAFNDRDRNAVAALMSENVVCAGIPLAPSIGKGPTMGMLAPFLEAEEIDWQVIAIAANGGTVFTERVDGFRFAGQDWTYVRAAGVCEIDGEGKIAAWRDYFDLEELRRAMPPSKSRSID